MANNSRRPYEWAAVVSWSLSLFLLGLTTARTPFGSGMDRLALGLFSGIVWAVIGGLIVALWKYFKRSPVVAKAGKLDVTKTHDKALFIVAMVIAAFLVGKGLYLETYGSFIDAAILLALGFGVRAGLHLARWLFSIYAFVTPILVIGHGGGNAVIWPFVFFYACRSIILQGDSHLVEDMGTNSSMALEGKLRITESTGQNQTIAASEPTMPRSHAWVIWVLVLFPIIGIIAAIAIPMFQDRQPIPAAPHTSPSVDTETAKTAEGANVAASSKCDTDRSCSSGLYCISGQCRQRGTARASCDRPIECAEGFECRVGHCEAEYKLPNLAKGVRCNTDGECASTLYCVLGVCSEQAKTGQPCARNTECAGDLRCNNGVCMKAKS
jgi:hypothetical protein